MQIRQIALVATLVFLAYLYFIAYFVFVRRATSKLAHESYAKYKYCSAAFPSSLAMASFSHLQKRQGFPDGILDYCNNSVYALLDEQLRDQ